MDMHSPAEFPIKKLIEIRKEGLIKDLFPGTKGYAGNTILKRLGLYPSNSTIPNTGIWQIKTHQETASSLLTLFDFEPYPNKSGVVSNQILPRFGWKHRHAGIKYAPTELYFGLTINAITVSERGFNLEIDESVRKISLRFNFNDISDEHKEWAESVKLRSGIEDFLQPPYWNLDDIYERFYNKANYSILIPIKTKVINYERYFMFGKIWRLKELAQPKFIDLINRGVIYLDFNARTNHNHGTRFRIRKGYFCDLYEEMLD
ncbi:MAG: MvaI/BcnI family restriction endonuclease [Candidatus Symbiobacter sp.]|nr:MvaI/BcnI family restriction endonuclease [Candidatus Symbiobacter sp.]